MREIVFDTETTGLEAHKDDRLVEIGCVEVFNYTPTGNTFHVYINPQRSMPVEAFRVHGLSEEFLKDKPLFAEIADDFLAFVGDSKLVAHNANFDMGFINAELKRLQKEPIPSERVIDTLQLARRKHPNTSNKLDDLCARYGIDNSSRVLHGALLDAELLAEVYSELVGGKQAVLGLGKQENTVSQITGEAVKPSAYQRPKKLATRLTDADKEKHTAFINTFKSEALWKKYLHKKSRTINAAPHFALK